MPIFFDDVDKISFLKMLRFETLEMNIRVFAYCLMPNHYHLFVQTEGANLDKFMQKFISRYVQLINIRHNRVGSLFQGRYQDRLVDVDSYALKLTQYIHLNPVIAGYVEKPQDYPWSSYANYRDNQASWIETNLVLEILGGADKASFKQFEKFHQAVPEGSDPYRSQRIYLKLKEIQHNSAKKNGLGARGV